MKKPYWIGPCIAAAAIIFLSQPASVFADEAAAPGRMAEQSREFDWLGHTRLAMEELKGKLDLAPEQMTAWDAWFRGVMNDARRQLEHMKSASREMRLKMKHPADDTTPERMAREIGRLRAETVWMQEHLDHLDAALVRTRAFYNALDTKQKTIFDLFWHELYHRVSGHDDDMGAEAYGGSGPDSMMEEAVSPSGGH